MSILKHIKCLKVRWCQYIWLITLSISFDLGECDKVLAERDGSDGSKYKNCCGRDQRGRCERGQTYGYCILALGYLTSLPSIIFLLLGQLSINISNNIPILLGAISSSTSIFYY